METREDRWRANLLDEWDGVALYEGLARLEKDAGRAAEFTKLAGAERRHAGVWQNKLERSGVPVPPARPSARVRLLLFLARKLGTRTVLPLVVMNESNDVAKYARQGGEGTEMAREEQAHGETLRRMNGESAPRARIAGREGWHRFSRGGALRAAVFGMNDGLVSNLALVLGVVAAGAAGRTVVVTGLAGLFAGALSMAIGEYVSMATQRDVLRRQIALERREVEEAPEEEEAELADLLRDKGLSPDQARSTAHQIMSQPETALDTLVREELGLDPGELGSPVRASLSSFATFAVGAALPLAPFLFTAGREAAVAAALLSGIVLATVGAFLGFASGGSAVRAAVRMVGLAAIAAAVTVAVGRLVGVGIG